MRELKFRAWDKQEKQMMKVSAISLENKEIGVKNFRTYHFFRIKNIELMQYTGLKDKNGTEIYEGDIVKFTHKIGYGWGNNKGDIAEIKYMIDGVSFSGFGFRNSVPLTANKANKLEVIGNIHENPELLEKK